MVSCGRAPAGSTGVHRLVDDLKPEMVQGRPADTKPPEPAGYWNFKEGTASPVPKEAPETLGWKTGVDVAGLTVKDGHLTGRSTSGFPILYVNRMPAADEADVPHSIEIHMRADKGANLSISSQEEAELNFKEIVGMASVFPWFATTPIVPGDDFQTYTVRIPTPVRLSTVRYLLIRPTDADQAIFEIESVRVVSRKEFLSRIPSGVGWQGLSEIYRETVVSRAPETIRWELQLPDNPVLELHVGTIEYGPVRFRLAVAPGSGGSSETVLAEHTVTTPHRWESLPANLNPHAGQPSPSPFRSPPRTQARWVSGADLPCATSIPPRSPPSAQNRAWSCRRPIRRRV
jgi:hypothetical protein